MLRTVGAILKEDSKNLFVLLYFKYCFVCFISKYLNSFTQQINNTNSMIQKSKQRKLTNKLASWIICKFGFLLFEARKMIILQLDYSFVTKDFLRIKVQNNMIARSNYCYKDSNNQKHDGHHSFQCPGTNCNIPNLWWFPNYPQEYYSHFTCSNSSFV